MVERKLERDRVRPFHPLVHVGHPTHDEGGTRLHGVSSVRKDAGPCSNLADAPQGMSGGSSRDPSTNVERRSGPRTRVSTVRKHPAMPIRPAAMLDGTCFFAVTTNASKRSSRRTPRPHGRREDPQPNGWTASDEEAGAERSEALSLVISVTRRTRAAACEQGARQSGMLAHRVRDASTAGAILWSKDLEGDQSPGRVGRTVAGNGGPRYGPIRGATPRR